MNISSVLYLGLKCSRNLVSISIFKLFMSLNNKLTDRNNKMKSGYADVKKSKVLSLLHIIKFWRERDVSLNSLYISAEIGPL